MNGSTASPQYSDWIKTFDPGLSERQKRPFNPNPNYPKPATLLNVTLFFTALTLYVAALYAASHAPFLWEKALAVLVFAYVGNTLFALLHESVHQTFSQIRWVNETFGILCAASFPTGLTFQRTCHLGHHLRNRTDHEMFDYFTEDDFKPLKYAQFYSIMSGIYWLVVNIGWSLYLVCPWVYRLLKTDNTAIVHTGAAMMHPFINHPRKIRIRLELLFTIAFIASLFVFLHLSFLPTFVCFWIFGMNWGSLQYADHAWSPRDIRKGAWNLRINPVVRYLFLNYHLHLAHHDFPRVPWNHLPEYVDPSAPQPRFFRILFEMMKGPKAYMAPPPPAAPDAAFLKEIEDDGLCQA